jgi:hypothetical protein
MWHPEIRVHEILQRKKKFQSSIFHPAAGSAQKLDLAPVPLTTRLCYARRWRARPLRGLVARHYRFVSFFLF